MTAKEACSQLLTELSSDDNGAIRLLAIYSAVIALDEEELLRIVVNCAARLELKREALYEVVLQSYLFLGFPRMLNAATILHQQLPTKFLPTDLGPVSTSESKDWWERGTVLCRLVYGDKYELLKKKVMAMSPEVFHWMLIEGYGKVLSRDGLSIQKREVSIIAFLTIDNRPKQLRSHILGALNVGVTIELMDQVIADLRFMAPDGCDQADKILAEIKSN